MTFPVLSSDLYKLSFADLLNKNQISLRLYKKLVNYARLTTVGDLYMKYRSVTDFVNRVPSTGEKVKLQLTEMLTTLANDCDASNCEIISYQGLEDTPSVSSLPDVSFPDLDEEIRQITFDALYKKGLIAKSLHNKLTRDAGLERVGDLLDKFTSIESFIESTPYTGSKTNERIAQMLEMVASNPTALAAQAAASGIQLPYTYDDDVRLGDALHQLLVDSIAELKQKEMRSKRMQGPVAEHILIRNLTYEETGLLIGLTRERVRQIRGELIDGFRVWLTHGVNPLLRGFYIAEGLRQRTSDLISNLSIDFGDISSEEQIEQWLSQQGITSASDDAIARRFFLLLAGAELTGKVESRFSKTRFYVLNSAFSKADFLKVGELTLDALAGSVTPQSTDSVVLAVNRLLKKEKVTLTKGLRTNLVEHVQNALTYLPEVEQLQSSDGFVYQLFFSNLSHLSMAERVLSEEGRAMYYSEIASALQVRLQKVGVHRDFEETNLKQQIGTSKRINHYGKNSLYSIKDSKAENAADNYTKTELSIRAIELAQKPLSVSDVNSYINNFLIGLGVPGDQSQKSTASLLSYALKQPDGVCRLQNGRYILKKWEHQYVDSLETTPTKALKGSLFNKVQSILAAAPECTMVLKTLSRQLIADGHPRPSIGSVFKQTAFNQFEQDGKKYIQLRQDVDFVPKVLKKEQIKDRVVNLLSTVTDRRLPMRAIVKQIEKEFTLTKTQRPVVYKTITENPRLFFKEWDDKCQVTLLEAPGELEKANPYDAERDGAALLQYMIEHVEATVNPVVQHSFITLADRFHQFALADVPCEDLEGIRLLPWYLWNYYTNPNSQATHLYARAVIASMEPYLQKILYVANAYYFQEFQQGEKGIALLMKKLYKANPWKLSATKVVYDKARKARNSIAHAAQLWNPVDERMHVQACLSFIIYVVDSYYTDLSTCGQ